MAQQERALIELLPAEPARHFVVALAGIAGTTSRHDVVERVAPAARDREHAVALEWPAGRAAVRAAAPRRLDGRPLLIAEVVLDATHPALALARGLGCARSLDRHGTRVCTADARQAWPQSTSTRCRHSCRSVGDCGER